MAKPKKAEDIDGYIAQFPADVQAILQKVRTTISTAAPEAKETISYLMPAFRLHGILVYFAAWEKHIGLYPPISGDKALERAVAPYATASAYFWVVLVTWEGLRPGRVDCKPFSVWHPADGFTEDEPWRSFPEQP